ncbi:hypothetical protein GW916_10230 [bacterium]|nr:hypothetical protein [bacterium]
MKKLFFILPLSLLILSFDNAQAADEPRNECAYSELVVNAEPFVMEKLFYGFEYSLTDEGIQANVEVFKKLDWDLQQLIRFARLNSVSTRSESWARAGTVPVKELVDGMDYLSIKELSPKAIGKATEEYGVYRWLYLVDIAVGGGNGAYMLIEKTEYIHDVSYRVIYEDFDGELFSCKAE